MLSLLLFCKSTFAQLEIRTSNSRHLTISLPLEWSWRKELEQVKTWKNKQNNGSIFQDTCSLRAIDLSITWVGEWEVAQNSTEFQVDPAYYMIMRRVLATPLVNCSLLPGNHWSKECQRWSSELLVCMGIQRSSSIKLRSLHATMGEAIKHTTKGRLKDDQ